MNESNWAWRAPSLVQAGYPCIQVIFWWFLPESPRWLIANGRQAEARKILAWFHTGGDEGHQLLAFETKEISRTIELEQEAKSTKWSALIADTQTLINGILQTFNFAAAVSAAFLVDRLGRRTLFIWSGAGMLISFIIWTACSAVFDEQGPKGAGIVVIAFIFIFFFHCDIAYTPLLLGYPREIFPYSLRSKGLTIELLTVYGSLIILSFVNPIALDNIGWHYYIVFCCLLAVFFVVTFFFFPETKGYSLEEIAEVFDGPNATKQAQNAAAIQSAKVENDSDYMEENEAVHNETIGKY